MSTAVNSSVRETPQAGSEFTPSAPRSVVHNTALNIVGQVLPAAIGALTVPYIVHHLGPDRFGILSIAWILYGYFALFDLGLGRATTKFSAEFLARNEGVCVARIAGTSVILQLSCGMVGAMIVALTAHPLITRVWHVPPSMITEAQNTLYVLAASLPIVLANNALRSVLEGAQRFDIVNALKVPTSASSFLVPALGVWIGLSLPGIVLIMALLRLVFTAVHFVYCQSVLVRAGSRRLSVGLIECKLLVKYGGWVSVSNVLNPILLYLDRFLIAMLLSVASVGYYTVPYEAVTKVWIIPASVASALFPAFSVHSANRNHMKLESLYLQASKFMIVALAPILFTACAFARPLLRAWIGPGFAESGAPILQILCIGVFLNCFAHVPFGLLQGCGQPQVAAAVMMVELPLYAVGAYLVVSRFGLVGAALAWTVRVALESCAFMWAVDRGSIARWAALKDSGLAKAVAGALFFAAGLVCTRVSTLHMAVQIATSAALVLVFLFGCWSFVLTADEKKRIVVLIPAHK